MKRALPVLVLVALAACQGNKPAPTVVKQSPGLDPSPYGAPANPQAAAATMEAWRPIWWLKEPVRDARGTSVAALGTDMDLLAARRKALEAAHKQLVELLGPGAGIGSSATPGTGSTADVTPAKADTIKLADGSYRTFVLVILPAPGGS